MLGAATPTGRATTIAAVGCAAAVLVTVCRACHSRLRKRLAEARAETPERAAVLAVPASSSAALDFLDPAACEGSEELRETREVARLLKGPPTLRPE